MSIIDGRDEFRVDSAGPSGDEIEAEDSYRCGDPAGDGVADHGGSAQKEVPGGVRGALHVKVETEIDKRCNDAQRNGQGLLVAEGKAAKDN